jgi:hypothetical protein
MKIEDRILHWMRTQPFEDGIAVATAKEIVHALNIPATSVYVPLNNLHRKGKLRIEMRRPTIVVLPS